MIVTQNRVGFWSPSLRTYLLYCSNLVPAYPAYRAKSPVAQCLWGERGVNTPLAFIPTLATHSALSLTTPPSLPVAARGHIPFLFECALAHLPPSGGSLRRATRLP